MSDSSTCNCRVEDRRIPALVLDNALRRIFRRPRRFLAKYLSEGKTAADLGCSSGFFTLPMARIVGRGGKVYGVDFDPRAIERLRRKSARRGVDSLVDPRAVSATEIDFIDDASVDFVLAEGLLCCMKDHTGAVRQIRRILKPGGRAYLGVIKFAKEGDPRGVSKEEWSSLLGEFRLVEGGETVMTRWAVVTKAA